MQSRSANYLFVHIIYQTSEIIKLYQRYHTYRFSSIYQNNERIAALKMKLIPNFNSRRKRI